MLVFFLLMNNILFLNAWTMCAKRGAYCNFPIDEYAGAIQIIDSTGYNGTLYDLGGSVFLLKFCHAEFCTFRMTWHANVNTVKCDEGTFGDPAIGESDKFCSWKVLQNGFPKGKIVNVTTSYFPIPMGHFYHITNKNFIVKAMGHVPLNDKIFGGVPLYYQFQGNLYSDTPKYKYFEHDLAGLYQDWKYCATEGEYCHLPDPMTVYTIIFGIGDENRYRNIAYEFTGPYIMCDTRVFPDIVAGNQWYWGDVSPFPKGKQRFCMYSKKTSFSNIVGYWKQVTSCVGYGCKITEVLTEGVSSQSVDSTSESWSSSLSSSTSENAKFLVFGASHSMNQQESHATSVASSEAFSKTFGQSCTASCGGTSNATILWQWHLNVDESCGEFIVCPFVAKTCNYVCTTSFSEQPLCPVNSCKNADCSECINNS